MPTAEAIDTSTTQQPAVRYSQLNVTLNIVHKDGASPSDKNNLDWIKSCLNCNPNHAEVEVTHPTGLLVWPDFLDDPGFREEHPDYPAAVDLLQKVEAWLTMDRKQLISALLQQHRDARVAVPRVERS